MPLHAVCYFTMVICLVVTIKAEQTANTETNDPVTSYMAELEKARVKRTTTYVRESYAVRYEYRCGFAWWSACSAYRTAYYAKAVTATVEMCQASGRFCYPGNCPDAASQCTCMDGFSDYNCLRIDNPPSIDTCIITVKNADTREEKESSCSSSNTMPHTVYVKDRSMTDISVSWSTHSNQTEGQSYPTKPTYVDEFNVGLVKSSSHFTFQQPGEDDISNNFDCLADYGIDNPISTRQSCQHDFTSTMPPVKDNSSLIVVVSAANGGFIVMNEGFNRTKYYYGPRSYMRAHFVYDLKPPYHCSLKPGYTCLDKMIDIGVGYTNQSAIYINWSGWMDDISGVEKYEVEVFPSVPGNGTIGCSPNADETRTMNENLTSVTINLHEPDVYCVLLVVSDNAENHRYAMRYLLFDDQNTVDIMPHYPMMVVSAHYTRDTYWQISGENMINVTWRGHFENTHHAKNGLLNPIRSSSLNVDTDYDTLAGQPPDTRSREGIPNINGIVKFEIGYAVDHLRSNISSSPQSSWRNIVPLKEEIELDIQTNDGDVVQVWVRAFDIMGNFELDNVVVHVDSSPPVVSDIRMIGNGIDRPAVHGSKDLFTMSFTFDAFDEHSGLFTIHWQLYDMADNSIIHDTDNVAVRKSHSANCSTPECICIPNSLCDFTNYNISFNEHEMNISRGNHDHDYVLAVTVTNTAALETTKTFQITIDVSPPLEGHVQDSSPGQPDLDYQQEYEIFASWDGFFDRESGIMEYGYFFGHDCLDDITSVNLPLQLPLRSTISTSARWTAPGPGEYHCTVIAYNRAMDPSKPVCSDGVTIDVTKPTLREILIDDVFVTPSLVKDVNGAVWFINENRYCQLIRNPSDHCRNVAYPTTRVDLYPQKRVVNSSDIQMEDGDCTSYGNIARQAFIRRENHIFLNWEGSDAESGIFDYEVGIGTTSAGLDPNIVPFTSTKGHREFQTYHPNLGEGVEFYISIKATNRAGLDKIETVGPFVVEVTPPSFQGYISVTSERDENKEFLVARWNTGSFYDDDQLETLKNYEVAIGDNEGETNVMSYVSIANLQSSVCQTTTPPTCAAIPTDILGWNLHGDHVYFMSIKVTNVAGLSVVATSNPYYNVVRLPSIGNVYETSSTNGDTLFGVQEDIDLQVDVNNIHCRWSGFSHPHQVINYELGLGISPDSANIVPFRSVGSDVTSYSFQDLTLVIYQKYYVIVRASTQTGTVTASSDGITVLANEGILTNAHVYDGLPCTLDSGEYEETASHHAYNRRPWTCVQDVDFQASTSTAGVHWVLQDHAKEYANYAEWSLQRKQVVNSSIIAWDTVTHYRKIESASFCQAADILLLPGQHYRSVVKFCFQGGCFQPVASDGFWVIPFPPIPGEILEFSHSNLTDTISIRWNAFEQDELTEDTDEEAIDYYEWSLSVASRQQGEIHEDVLFPWQRITVTESSDNLLDYSIQTPYPIDFSKCIQLGLRGYNKAGLYTTIYRDIQDCNVRSQNLVIDSVGDYDQSLGDVGDVVVQENNIWLESDREYTRSHNKLSAVWPTLQHGNFSWKVVSDQTLNHLAYHRQSNGLDFYTYDCSAPEILACGQSNANYVNVGNLNLKHGWRYYICVNSNQTTKIYGNTQTLLPEVAACSNGIVADHTPPNAGRAWIGWKEQLYQASRTDLVVNWDGFYDVEEHGRTSHPSGIRRYEVAVGTSPGGVDVQDFQSVGVANWLNLYNLNLISGHTYYATVRAIDFVGLSIDVVSSGVTVDTSPPLKSEQSINVGGPFITSKSFIAAEWKQLFSDEESGISYYEWCMGSKPGYADVFPCTSTDQEQITLQADDGEPNMVDGHIYYVMVKAYNGAGLSTVGVSWALLYDTSPPEAGYVYDGCDKSKDKDYQMQLNYLCAQWHGFRDPHCAIKGYSWKIGSCPGCHDIVAEENIGWKTAMNANYLQLEPGTRYFTTIIACNVAGLCTSVSSDGIIPENSPPVAGNVYDGINDGDLEFQSSKTTLTAHWYNFHDPHSQLSHYEVRAGTSIGSGDVLSNTRLHLTEKIFTSTLLQSMPMNRPVYVTVRAYNKAGLFVEQSSNGVTVDETPPIVTNIPTIDNSIGSFTGNTQVWHSLLRVSWEFRDNESPLQYYLLSVFTHHQSESPAPTVKLPGSFRQYTFTNLTMHDGDSYYVKVIGCNAAKLCRSSESTGILIDSSPPTVGTFAIDTDHAAGLIRHRDGWMTYQQRQGGTPPRVKLSWLGFSDIHSGISHYNIAIGSQFGMWDLTQNDTVEIINQDGVPHLDEGVIQTASVDVARNLVPGEHIYCTIWAVNGVGQRGYEAQESFTITRFNDERRILSLLRRCDVQTCQGDCTCAPQNQACQRTSEMCTNESGNSQYQQVEVYDIIDYRNVALNTDVYQDVDLSPSRCTIASRWRVLSGGNPVQRYEWSVGSKDEDVGAGLLNPAFDRLWHDAGQNTFAVFTKQDGPLNSRVFHVFYVKAWYDDQRFAIFRSDGVKPDYTPPSISSSRKVKDILNINNLIDVDYSTSVTAIGVAWKNVFLNSDTSVETFKISLSTYPGGEDIVPYDGNTYSSHEFTAMLSRINLKSGVTYYANVMAINHVGLMSIASSDGVTIDSNVPKTGIVYDGLGLEDADYQNSSTVVSASWQGFSDLESSIDHYVWCVGRSPGAEDILPCHDVGLHLSKAETLVLPITSGERYFSKVMAVDAAGLVSLPAVSDGVILDTSAPVVRSVYFNDSNLIDNPSFEEIQDTTEDRNSTDDCADGVLFSCQAKQWQIEGIGYVQPSAQNAHLVLYGSVSQYIGTVEGDKYKLSFHVSHTLQSSTPLLSQEGYVDIPGIHRVFHLFQRAGSHGDNGLADWFEHAYYFTADSASSKIEIGSLGERSAIALDNIRVQRLSPITDTDDVTEEFATAIAVDVRTDRMKFAVIANWDMIDIESAIIEYLWAIGTVKGGTQIQTFKSVGRLNHAIADDLVLTHGLPIYVTVVTKNAAELQTAIYSEPWLIDLTPPDMCCVMDGEDEDVDAVYQTTSNISVHWNVSDPESGVQYCEWAAGFSPGSEILMSFTRSESLAFAQVNFTNSLEHGQKVYCTVRCHNGAGLFTQQTSNGVIIIKDAPSSSEGTLHVVTSSPTIFGTRHNHQADTGSIAVVWNGFMDVTGIAYYECKFVDGSNDTEWRSVGLNGENTALLTGVDLNTTRPLTYQIQLRAINHGGFICESLTANVTVESSPPVLTGIAIKHTWQDENTVLLSWNDVFYSQSLLIYELTVTTLHGGNTIVKWFETRETTYQLTDIDPSMEYYMIVTAVNEAGLSNSVNKVFLYSNFT